MDQSPGNGFPIARSSSSFRLRTASAGLTSFSTNPRTSVTRTRRLARPQIPPAISLSTVLDAWYGYKNEIITATEFKQIATAFKNKQMPPFCTTMICCLLRSAPRQRAWDYRRWLAINKTSARLFPTSRSPLASPNGYPLGEYSCRQYSHPGKPPGRTLLRTRPSN